MTVLLHLSDPHFGTERPEVVAALRRFAHGLAADLLVLSGDITQRARPAQFRAARAFVDSLGIGALLAIPGNHDIPLFNLVARIAGPFRNHRAAFGSDLEPTFESADLLVLAVNTTRRWRHEDGAVSAAQIDRVAARRHVPGAQQLRVVVTHQPVAVMRPQDEPDRLHGGAAAVQAWARAGVDLVLGGHIHLPFVLPLHEQRADLPRRCWAVQAGTAVSDRVRHEADNSVNVIRVLPPSGALTEAGPGGARGARRAWVERWDYRADSASFERAAVDQIEADDG